MKCERVVFSGHALRRMFERAIGRDAVLAVISTGEPISEYAGDLPYPSRLLLGFVGQRPIHVVVAFDHAAATCIVVTVYEPSPEQWGTDFKTRKAK
jgi:hypothetical protein